MDSIDTENSWYLETAKALITLNSGAIIALLAMTQALIANGHFREMKSFIMVSLAIFLVGICCGVGGLRARGMAWSATIAGSTEPGIAILFRSMSRSRTSAFLSLVSFVSGCVWVGIGMALRL